MDARGARVRARPGEELQSVTAERHACGKEERPAGYELLGLPHIGHDFFGWGWRAGLQPRKRKRRTHQFKEIATVERCSQSRRLPGETRG